MALSYELISQFAKITNDKKEMNKESNVYGTIVRYGNANYVRLDGSDLLTPYESTIAVDDGDRVLVAIKNHSATITGSTTNPSASNKELVQTNEKVAKFNTVMADKIKTGDLEAINGYFQQILAITGKYEDLTAVNADIETLKAKYASMDELSAADAKIINAEIDVIVNKVLESQEITTQEIEAVKAEFSNLTAYNAKFVYLMAEVLKVEKADIAELNAKKVSTQALEAVQAQVDNLNVNMFDAESGHVKFLNVDFSNIDIAWIGQFFSESGIIQNVQTEQGYVSGQLYGVTINGDMIIGNSIQADKLVIKGNDGIYYKLNIDGLNNISTSQASKFVLLETEPEDWETNYADYYIINNNEYIHITGDTAPTFNANTYYKLSSIHGTGLDGTNILAQTITADKITVSDLVAFGATIGGFHISNHSIYSGVKTSVLNNTRGIYMDDNGQIAIGDSNNYLRYYLDENTNTYKLEISAGTIEMGGTGKTLQETIDEIEEKMTVHLVLESSRGTVFKNNQASTVISVIIYRGNERITNMTDLRTAMGNNVYLQWKWRRITDNDYGIISSSDSHISEQGFKYTISPTDVDTQVTYMCELINN